MTDYTTLLERLVTWALAHPDLATAAVTLLVGGTEAARRYRRTGQVPLRTLPWRAFRKVFYELRRTYVTTPKPPDRALAPVEETLAELRATLGTQGYELEWPLSYHYQGEDLNARRYYFAPEREYPHRQLHIRAWEAADGRVVINAHEEASAVQHPRRHLSGDDMVDATDWVAMRCLDGDSLDPRAFDANPA